ncbi:hypothetical protein FQR65_LT08383 [Abscondita terminalis]|nr:hypothetical protein FQR65_LT08383 [Abscondita terminalis]
MVSRYVNGPVKQEGICFLPPHPQHYRMMAHQRTDGYHVTTPPTFVQQQQTQPNNQVQPLRMPPAGPPTQSSTPPNSDLKVQSMTQQPSMNIAYVPPAQVRGPAQSFFSRPNPPPNTQTPRMSSHRQGQPQMFQSTSAPFVPLPAMQTAVYLNTPFYSNTSRPQGFVPSFPMIPNPHIYQYTPPQSQPQAYFYSTPIMPRAPPPVATAPQNSTQPPPSNMPISQPPASLSGGSKHRRRSNAIPIIDPTTGKDKLKELYDQESEESLSHPPSGESSARETPQPPITNPSKEVQATFAKQVAQAINKEVSIVEEIEQPIIDHIGMPMYSSSQNVQQSYDRLAQSSKLQAATKEFIPANATPVVSAITDAEEVTINISNKQKDRESPAKGRKPREQVCNVRDTIKESSPKEALIEKPISSRDELKSKDLGLINVGLGNKDALTPNHREEKKTQKKEKLEVIKSSGTSGCEEGSSESALVISISHSIPDSSVISVKPKHNAPQKVKETSKQQTVTSQSQQQIPLPGLVSGPEKLAAPVQQQPPAIPPPQQAKTTSKSNKMRDLNLKGASKEGTDMDAFNDNATFEDANANDPLPANNDYININNSNNVMLNNNSNISSNSVEPKPTENKEITTINKQVEVKTCLKSKVDVTNVFKEIPKLEKIVTPSTVIETEDKTDQVLLDNDKLVQVKNEVNSKVSIEVPEANTVETKLTLPYKEDQWSPTNPEGKKVYDKDFLLSLKGHPNSKQKPDNLLADILANDDRGVREINRYAVGGRATDFAPNFSNNYSSKSSSQRGGIPPKRKSQQGSIGGSNKGSKQNVIRVSISVKEDVKLHESENAWKPARFVASANMTEDEKKTEELYKKVRGVLNKLTPQKFNTLLDQIKNFNIDTSERLQGVIDLVFEKAVDEPNFSVAYATLCGQLALMQVPASSSNKKDGQQEFVNFRKLLVTRCQLEFEKNSIDEAERNVKVKEIDECVDPDKKKDLLLDLEDYDRRLRMKSVGNIRFIGELFKQHMLTVNIMMRCLNNLLNTKDEESLECLCKLLTTVGKELECNKKENLQPLFNTMKDISEKKDGKISSRVRFMIQDVIDLRASKWVPRRQDLNPKTMDQIQKEAETEQLNIQAMNSGPLSRRDDRGTVGGGSNSTNSEKKRRNMGGESDWSVASSRGNRTQPTFSIQCDKLKMAPMAVDEPLGNSQMFGSWVRGSKVQNQPVPNTSNMYAALETLDTDKSSMGLRREYNLKGPSMERFTRKSYEDGRGSRSGSQHRSRDSSTTSQRNAPPAQVSAAPKPAQPSQPIPPPLSDELNRKIKNIIDESLNDFCTLGESDEDVRMNIPTSAHTSFVSNGYMCVLDRSQTARVKAGTLFAHLIKSETLSLQDYCFGLEIFLGEAEELIIDIPMVWVYVAELIVPVLCEKVITFRDLLKPFEGLISNGHASKVLTTIFKTIIQELSPKFLQSSWNSSGLKFSHFMHESEVEAFLKNNVIISFYYKTNTHSKFVFQDFEVLLGNNNDQISPSHGSCGGKKLEFEEIQAKLLSFFKSNTSFDVITNWIIANVGDAVKENQFFRVLTTAIFDYAIVNKKLKDDILQDKYHFFQYYVDNKPDYELQCLYALQSLLHKLEYPQGLLLQIFNKLYEESVFSHESFLSWDASTDPAEQEGRGVAIMQLTSFFTQLKEADEDSSSSCAEDEPA